MGDHVRVIVTPPNQRLVTCDMEGTLCGGTAWQGLRHYLVSHGRGPTFRQFFRRNLWGVLQYRLGWGNTQKFREDWVAGMLKLFAGFSEEEFTAVADWVTTHELWPQRREAVIAELKAHKTAGRRVVILSGMLNPLLQGFTNRLADNGLQVECIGTPVELVDGVLTGEIQETFTTGARKAAVVRRLLGNQSKLYAAYGDTAADLLMLEMAEHPVAVAPQPQLRNTAVAEKWRIIEANQKPA